MTLLKQLNAEGQTILMVTHDERLIPCFTRVIRMRDGCIDCPRGKSSPCLQPLRFLCANRLEPFAGISAIRAREKIRISKAAAMVRRKR